MFNSFCEGRGIYADSDFEKGKFLFTYHGELVTWDEGEKRELQLDSVYRYFFRYKGKKLW